MLEKEGEDKQSELTAEGFFPLVAPQVLGLRAPAVAAPQGWKGRQSR